MNLFQMASRGVSLDALPDEPLPEREPLDLGAPAVGQRFTVPDALNGAFDAAAQEYGVDADVLRAMAYAESGFRPDVISGQVKSSTGATGLLQFMPQTAERFGIDATDPVQSIFGAAAYMRSNLDKFGGDYGKAVAAYNWGENRRAFDSEDWQGKAPDETRNYLKKVFATADDLKARAPTPAPAAEAQPAPAAAPVAAQAPARKEVPGMTLGSVLQDVASGALQIGPTAIKGAADLARLATGDYLGKDLSDSMEGGMAAIRSTVGSDRAAAQRENFNRDMADPNVGIGQALANNKGALADQVLPTLGSMLLPVGAAGLAGKAATVGKTAAALETAALASRVATAQQAAGIGATAAQNAADVFAGLVDKGVPMEDAYKAAGITVPFSVIAGKLTGGGAEVALARQAAGQAVKGGALGVAKGAAREGAQEVGEELGQVTGEAVGTGVTPDATTAGKRLAVAGTLGAVVGGGVDVAGNFGATPRVEDQPVVPIVPPVTPRQEPTLDVTYENADGQTVTEVIRGNQPAPQPEGTAWSDVAAADKRAQAEAEVARKLAEVDGAPPVVPAATAPADAQAAPVSELTAPVGDIARQVLSGEAIPAAPAAAPAAPDPVQVAPTVEQAEQQLAARESAQAAPVDMQMRSTGTLMVKGDPVALRDRLAPAGVDNTIAVPGGLIVARSQAAKAQEVLSAQPQSNLAPATPLQTPVAEVSNVPQSTPQAAQQPAEAASPAAPVVGRTDAPVPAGPVPAAGTPATQAPDVAAPAGQYSKGMTPELASAIMAIKPPARATVESVNQAMSEVVPTDQPLPRGLGKVVVAKAKDIKAQWEPLIGKADMNSEGAGRAQGFYDPPSKTVFIVADNIKPGDEKGVIAHELMHKHGQAVLGRKGWDQLHTTLGAWAGAKDGSQERQVYDEAAVRVQESRPDGAEEGRYSNQEMLPYAVQVATEMGIKPSIGAPLGSVSRWLYQVRTALAQVWTRITDRPETFKTQDLVNLAFGIAQRENPAHRGELDNVTEAEAKPAVEPAQAPATEPEPPMYSRAKPEEAAAPPPAEPAAAPVAPERELTPVPEETGFRKVQRVMQDKFNRITVLSNWARDNDIQLSSEADVWGYEARMHGTVATRVEDFREDTVKPLIERIQKAGYSMEQVAEYLHAKHAQERNAQIESIDPAIKDGSGMTNAEAQAILAKAPEKMATLAAEVQAITGSTRQILLDAGIITQEMADAWDAAYKNYVPLKGEDKKVQGGTGKGLSVDGRQKRALGHGARDEKIVENILRDHERAIMLAEKNKIGQSLLVLVDELNNPEIATIGQPEKRRVLKQGSMFEARTSDGIVVDSFATQQQALNFVAAHPDMKLHIAKVTADPMVVSMASPMLGPNEVQVYLKGHAVRVQLNDELLSRAYQNLGPENFTVMMKINREVNAAMSKMYTALNPEFFAKNVLRDFTAGLTITTAKYGAGVAARAVKNYPKAMAQLLYYGFTKKASPSMMSYRLAGGSTGAAYLGDLQRIGEDVQATFDDARGVAATTRSDGAWRGTRSLTRKALKAGLKYIEILNAAGESAMRLSVFEAMRETGHDVRESASASKELMNFNRQGEATRTVGGWYLFLNASIQGTAAIADALVHGKNREQGWAMVAGMAGLFYALAQAQFGDDDEGKKAWERISQDVKSKNLIIRTGKDSYATIPIPYGLGAFFGIGNAAYDLQRGEDKDKVALHLALNFADHFLPVKPYAEGGDTRGLVELVPGVAGGELMRAALRAGVNRSGLGGDIVPDSKFDEGKPDNLRAYRNTRTSVFQTIATQLNEATGGTPTQAGLVDVSPESLKYWTRTLTGGAGVFLADTFDLAKREALYYAFPDDPDREALASEPREIPVTRGFVREDSIGDDRRQYWAAAKDVSSAQQDFQRARKGDDEAGMQRVDDKRGELLYLTDAMTRNSGHIREIRDEIEAVMLDESTSMAFKRAAVKKLEAEESSIYREFIDMVAEDKADAAKERANAKPTSP